MKRTKTAGSRNVKASILIRVISWALIIFIIPLQLILQEPLQSQSVGLIRSIQDIRTTSGIFVFKIFHYFSNGVFLLVISPGIYNFLHPKRGPSLVIFFTLVHYTSNIIAMVLQEPRPYWVDSNLKGELCSEGFGNPSTAVIICASLSSTLFIELFHTLKYRYIAYTFLSGFLALASLSQVYLAEHFPHQVLSSLFLSFIFVTFFFSFSKKIRIVCQKSCYGYLANRVYLLYWCTIVSMLLLVVAVLQGIIYVVPSDYPKLISYSTRYCSVNYIPNGYTNALDTLELFYTLGFICGCLRTSKTMSMYWVVTVWWKRFLRYIISVGFSFAILNLFYLIPVSDIYEKMILHHAIPNFIISYNYTGLLPVAFKRIGLAAKMNPKVDKEPKLEKIANKIII